MLTIVNGVLNPPLPGTNTGFQIAMDSDIRCTELEYRVEVHSGDVVWVQEDGTQIHSDVNQTLSQTDCVLHDAERGISLQLRDDHMAHRSAGLRVQQFADTLRELHSDLIG